MEEFSPDSLGALRQLLTGGDVVPHEHAARTLARHPGLVITNGYGPTENTTFTLTHSVASPSDVDGPHCRSARRCPVPACTCWTSASDPSRTAAGELFAAGEGLADGYLGDPAETARFFGDFSPDVPERLYRTGDIVRVDSLGRVRFLGRRDDQVKLRGYRVEPGEIEAAMLARPKIIDAAVIAERHGRDGRRLVACYVSEADISVPELRRRLGSTLPSYMLPASFVRVDALPLNANGKVDRAALRRGLEVGRERPDVGCDYRPPQGPVEEALAGIWRDLMEIDEVGVDDQFFALGGHSLLAIRSSGRSPARGAFRSNSAASTRTPPWPTWRR